MSTAKIYEAQVTKSGAPFILVVGQSPHQDGYTEGTLIPPKSVATEKPFERIGLGTRAAGQDAILFEAVLELAREAVLTMLPSGSWLPREIVFTPLENAARLSARLSISTYPAWESALSSSHVSEVRNLLAEVRRLSLITIGGN